MSSEKLAFISLHEKAGLEDIAPALHRSGFEIISLGRTALEIEQMDIPVIASYDFIGMDIEADNLSGREDRELREIAGSYTAQHMALSDRELDTTNRRAIDFVCMNLMPPTIVVEDNQRHVKRDKSGIMLIGAANEGGREVLTNRSQMLLAARKLNANLGNYRSSGPMIPNSTYACELYLANYQRKVISLQAKIDQENKTH